jgi:hypothetical protein
MIGGAIRDMNRNLLDIIDVRIIDVLAGFYLV